MPSLSQDPSIDTPPDDVVISRYMDFTKFVWMLEEKALHFARVELLLERDPFEGSGSLENLDPQSLSTAGVKNIGNGGADSPLKDPKPRQKLEKHLQTRMALLKEQEKRTFVSSWYMGEHESVAMWKLFVTGDQGIAVRSTVGKVRTCFVEEGQRKVLVGAVRYVKFPFEVLNGDDPLPLFFRKRLSFEHEKELRAIIQQDQRDETAEHLLVSVDLNTMLTAVRVSPNARDWFLELVGKVMRRYGLTLSPTRSDLSAGY
jgi:hypothetical protein